MKRRDFRNSPGIRQIKKKKRKILGQKILFSFLLSAGIFTGTVFLFGWQKLNIQTVKVSEAAGAETEKIKQSVEKEISGNYLFFFPKKNFLLYPSRSILKKLSGEFKMFKDISLRISKDRALLVSLTPRKASYLWCGEEYKRSAKEPCYFLDDTGYIFEEAPFFSGNVYFKFYGKLAGEESNPAGMEYLSGIFNKIILFKKTLEEIGLRPFALQGMDAGNMEFFLSSSNSSPLPPAVIFNANGDFNILAENLHTALSTEPLRSDFQKKYSSLEYIDLRYGNRVYYRFR